METKNIRFLTVLMLLLHLNPSWEVTTSPESSRASLNVSEVNYEILDFVGGVSNHYPPNNLIQAVSSVINSNDFAFFQYGPTGGNLRLRQALAKFYTKFLNRPLSPTENVVTTVGSVEAVYATIRAFTKPGDEWIFFEPMYRLYLPLLNQSFGTVRPIILKQQKLGNNAASSDWIFDKSEFSRLFNNKTRGIVLNNPNFPIGKVFAHEELEFIAKLAKKWNVIVISDEVYEYMIYDNRKHIRIATLPGMFERTITISSISKSYSATGFRVGWVIGPKDLIHSVESIHQANTVSTAPFIEEGVAAFLEEECENYDKPSSYVEQMRSELEKKRNYMVSYLRKVGLTPIIPEGGFFIVANSTSFVHGTSIEDQVTEHGDNSFVNWLLNALHMKVRPLSEYYSAEHEHLGVNAIILCFARTDEQLGQAEQILMNWKENESKKKIT